MIFLILLAQIIVPQISYNYVAFQAEFRPNCGSRAGTLYLPSITVFSHDKGRCFTFQRFTNI